MEKIFVVGNWKMNPGTLKDARRLFNSIKAGVDRIKNLKKAEVVVCAPFIYLPSFSRKQEKRKSAKQKIKLGAQNFFWEEKGAFTGEVSCQMLKDLGLKYVIIGHSERRKYFSETDEIVNNKLKLALKSGLTPILCIDKISQIKKGMEGISGKQIKKIIVAYEPIWAIGTGKACGYKEAQEFNILMRDVLGKKQNTLYGGSVNSDNAKGYIKESGFQGLLIGGASLNSKEFIKIVKLFI